MYLIQPGEQLVNIGSATGFLSTSVSLSAKKLGAFLDDRQVGGEVGVEHRVEAEPAQRGNHLAGHQRPAA